MRKFGGFFILIIGVILFLHTLDILTIPIYENLISWQSLILIISLLVLLQDPCDIGSWIFVYISALFNLPMYTRFTFHEFFHMTFAPLLIWIGLLTILKSRLQGCGHRFNKGLVEVQPEDAEDSIHIFEKLNWIMNSIPEHFRLSMVFSGFRIQFNLNESAEVRAASDTSCHIRLLVLFSTCTLQFPEAARVRCDGLNLFGGVEDRRPGRLSKIVESPFCDIHIEAINIFGKIQLM